MALREPNTRLLQPAGNTPSPPELEKMKEAAHFYLATQKMHQGNNAEALETFKQIKTPYASFYTGEIFLKMALEEQACSGPHDQGGQVRELLVDSREAFYLTLDRLRGVGGGHHPLDSQLSEHLEEVENILTSYSGDSGADAEYTTPLTTPKKPELSKRLMSGGLTSTPQPGLRSLNTSSARLEARPSPERLDAQMRHLTGELSRTTSHLAKTVTQIGDTSELTKVVEASNKILGELKDNLVPLVKNIHDELREMRRDFTLRDDRYLDILRKIADSTAASASSSSATASNTAATASNTAATPSNKPAAPDVSTEERLLLESLGLSTSQLIQPLIQQYMLQQQLARSAAPMTGYPGISPMFPAAPIYNNPMPVSLPSNPLPPAAVVRERMMTPSMPPQLLPAQSAAPVQHKSAAPVGPAVPGSKAPPSNIVISVSDPIPSAAPVITAPMTVTVPPQHRLGGISNSPRPVSTAPGTPQSSKTPGTPGTPHGYQIQMPDGVSPLTVSPFKAGEETSVTVTTQSLLSSIPNPTFSAVTPSPDKSNSVFAASKTRVASGSVIKTPSKDATDAAEGGEEPEAYEPEVDFVPVIPLPEVVDVVTGEEGEEVMFEERAKLFRFSDDTKEWKERGLGQAKILRDKNSGKIRFLMRREQTFKVCANHQIIPTMKLDKMSSNAKARIWGAQDFAEEELKTEKFCIRFKTEEIADNFEKKFNEAVVKSNDAVSPSKPAKTTEADSKPEEQVKSSAASIGGFSFGTTKAATTTASSGFSFGQTSSVTSTTTSSTEPSKPSLGGFTFSTAPVVAKKTEDTEVKKVEKKESAEVKSSPFAAFSFGSKSNTDANLSFGSKAENITNNQTDTPNNNVFGSANQSTSSTFEALSGGEGFKKDPNFKGFAGAGTSLFGAQKKDDSAKEDEGGADEEYEPDVHFKPVLEVLPDLIEVKTGEEDEEVLFSNRAKLFRFVSETKEWKERGIGDFKILKNKSSGKVRFLMRREQVLKICCNHYLTKDMDFKPLSSSDKAWQWSAPDFAEEEVVNELLAIRFKTAELANDWKKIVDKCKTELVESPVKPAAASKLETEKVEDVKNKSSGGAMTLAQFAKNQKAASWECPLCLTRNDNSRIQCLACEGPRPGYEEEVQKLKDAAKAPEAVMTIGAGGGFKFGTGAAPAASSTTSSGFSFGSGSANTTATSGSSGFSFGSSSTAATSSTGGFSFSSSSSTEPTTNGNTVETSSSGFNFSGVKTSPSKPGSASPRKHNESTTSENEYYEDDGEGDNLYFEPVVPLPDKVKNLF